MININYTLFIEILIFIFVLIIINKFLLKPLLALFDARENLIAGNRELAQKLKLELDELVEKYEQRIREAKQSAIKERDRIRDEAFKLEEELIRKANTEAQDKLAMTREQISKEYESARNRLIQDAEVFAKEIVQRLLSRRLS